ncbi:MAG: hypothetical protein WC492_01395 [Candidatus Micrarchaeia archaeon]
MKKIFGIMGITFVALVFFCAFANAQLIGGGGVLPPVCTPEQRECVDTDSYHICNESGQWNDTIMCGLGARCQNGACTGFGTPVCTYGQRECTGTTEYRICDEYGQWGDSQSCGIGAECSSGWCQGIPAPVCTPGKTECVDSANYRTCTSSGQWGGTLSCPTDQVCSSGSCAYPPSPPQCSNVDSTRCSPSDSYEMQICNNNYKWTDWKRCDYGCKSGTCAVCVSGERTCASSSSYKVCLPSGQWDYPAYCQTGYMCSGSTCVSAPDMQCYNTASTRCSPNNLNMVQKCGTNSIWTDWKTCSLGCGNGQCNVCTNNDKQCSGSNGYQICTQGQWGAQMQCQAGYYCQNGTCQPPADARCQTPGQRRCSSQNPNMIQQCSAQYVYEDMSACSLGCFGGICTECKPGEKYCSGATTYRICSEDGQMSDDNTCPSGYSCEEGECVAAPTCSNGQTQCVADNVYTCSQGQWSFGYHCNTNEKCQISDGNAVCKKEQAAADAGGNSTIVLLGVVCLVLGGIVAYLLFLKKR